MTISKKNKGIIGGALIGLGLVSLYFFKWKIHLTSGILFASYGFNNITATLSPFEIKNRNGNAVLTTQKDNTIIAAISNGNFYTHRILIDTITGNILQHLPDIAA